MNREEVVVGGGKMEEVDDRLDLDFHELVWPYLDWEEVEIFEIEREAGMDPLRWARVLDDSSGGLGSLCDSRAEEQVLIYDRKK